MKGGPSLFFLGWSGSGVDPEGQHSNRQQTTTTSFVGGCDANILVDLAGQLSNQGRPLERLVKMWTAGNAPWTPRRRSKAPRSPVSPRTRRQRPLTPGQVQELVADYAAGVTINDLANRFEVHRDTVFEHLKREGVPRRRPPLDRDQIAEVLKLYKDERSVAFLARQYEVSPTTILRTLHREGVSVRGSHWRPTGG